MEIKLNIKYGESMPEDVITVKAEEGKTLIGYGEATEVEKPKKEKPNAKSKVVEKHKD